MCDYNMLHLSLSLFIFHISFPFSSGAQHNESAGFAIITDGIVTTFEVHDGVSQYISHYNFTLDGWLNIAMTWNWLDGITAYVNGVMQSKLYRKM